jgi:hypothetical protein
VARSSDVHEAVGKSHKHGMSRVAAAACCLLSIVCRHGLILAAVEQSVAGLRLAPPTTHHPPSAVWPDDSGVSCSSSPGDARQRPSAICHLPSNLAACLRPPLCHRSYCGPLCLMQRSVRHLQGSLAATCFTTRCRSDVGHTDHEGRRILLCLSWLDHPPSRPRVALGWACSLTAEGSLSSLRLGRLLRGWPSWVRDPPASSQLGSIHLGLAELGWSGSRRK